MVWIRPVNLQADQDVVAVLGKMHRAQWGTQSGTRHAEGHTPCKRKPGRCAHQQGLGAKRCGCTVHKKRETCVEGETGVASPVSLAPADVRRSHGARGRGSHCSCMGCTMAAMRVQREGQHCSHSEAHVILASILPQRSSLPVSLPESCALLVDLGSNPTYQGSRNRLQRDI